RPAGRATRWPRSRRRLSARRPRPLPRVQSLSDRVGEIDVTDADALLQRAISAAAASPNKIRKVGAVLIAAGTEVTGCNAFPPGIKPLPERAAGDNRFIWLEHAERSALFEAARRGIATDGATLLSTYFPCTD